MYIFIFIKKNNTNKLKEEGIFLPEIHDAVKECLLEYKNSLGDK